MFFDPILDPSPGAMPAVTFGAMVDSVVQNMMGRSASKSTSFAREFDDYDPKFRRLILAIAIAYNHYQDFAYGQPGGDPVDTATHDVVIDRLAITPGVLSFYNVQYSFHLVPKTGLEAQATNGLSLPQMRVIRMEDLPIVQLSTAGHQCQSVLASQVYSELENFPIRWGFSSDKEVDLVWNNGTITLTATIQLVQSKPEAPLGEWRNGQIEFILKKVVVESPKNYNEDGEPLTELISIYNKVDVIFDEHGNSSYMADLSAKLNLTFWQMFMNLENRMFALETNRFG